MTTKELGDKHDAYIVEQRRWFHRHPDLSYQEENTTKAIAAQLEGMGIAVAYFKDLWGCVGTLDSGKPGPTVLLRADIDALAVTEKTGLPFASETPGKMHACGHDAHISMLLGAARILADLKDELRGKVKFFFQSGEETAVGAKLAVDQGLLEGVDAVYGMHIWSAIESGKFVFENGDRMASCGTFTLTIRGEAAHGSAPHLGHDAIVAASSVIMNLQTLVSRGNDPLNALVVSVGTFNGGQRFNIIADKVAMDGTVRTYDRDCRLAVEGKIRDLAEKVAGGLGCKAELQYNYLTGPIINEHPELVGIAREAATEVYGPDALGYMDKITGSEDFAYLMEGAPGIYGFLGCRNPAIPGSTLSHHHEEFTVDETALHRGSAVMAEFAKKYLFSR